MSKEKLLPRVSRTSLVTRLTEALYARSLETADKSRKHLHEWHHKRDLAMKPIKDKLGISRMEVDLSHLLGLPDYRIECRNYGDNSSFAKELTAMIGTEPKVEYINFGSRNQGVCKHLLPEYESLKNDILYNENLTISAVIVMIDKFRYGTD